MQNAYAMAQRWLCNVCRAKEAVIQASRYIEKRPQGFPARSRGKNGEVNSPLQERRARLRRRAQQQH
jgi:hypothetical protein